MKNNFKTFGIRVFFLAILLAGCNIPEADSPVGVAETAASVIIVSPADGAQLNIGDLIDVQSQVSNPQGGRVFSLIVNGQPTRQDEPNTPMYSGSIYQPWQPLEEGTYTLQVIMQTSQGGNQESNVITVQVGGEQAPQGETPAEETPTNTPTPTQAPDTPTPTLSPAVFTTDTNSNCRSGPASVFDLKGTMVKDETVPIVGVGEAPYQTYWVVDVNGNNCWVWSELGQASGDYQNVPVIVVPQFPTPTPEPLSAPVLISPSGALNCASVTGGTTLMWAAVSHSNGIDHYEWALEGPANETGTTAGTQATTSGAGLFCAGANYQWRVRAIDGNGNIGHWSSYMPFNVP